MIADPTTENAGGDNVTAAAVNEAESLIKQNAAKKAAMVGLNPEDVKVAETDWAAVIAARQSSLAVKIHIFCPTFETVIDEEDFGILPEDKEQREAWRRNVKQIKIGTLPEKTRRKVSTLKGRRVDLYGKYANETSFEWGGLIKLGETQCGQCKTKGKFDLAEHISAVHPAPEPLPENDADVTPEMLALWDKAMQHNVQAHLGRSEGWNFAEWLTLDNKIVAEFNEVREYIHDNWDSGDDLMSQMRAEYKLIGTCVYARLKAAGKMEVSLEEFVDQFVSRRMAKIVGKREEVYAAMSMTREIRDVPLAAEMAQDQKDAEKILLEKAQLQAELTTMEAIQVEKIRTAREEAKEGAKTLLADLKTKTNGLVFTTARNVLKAIQDNGEVPGGSVRGVRNLVENIERLVIVPDAQIEEAMAQIRKLLAQESLNDNVGDVQTVMKRIAAQAKLTLLELDREVDSSREVGVPDTEFGIKRMLGLEQRGGQRETLSFDTLKVAVPAGDDGQREF